jgi:hypothetical protein
LRQIFDSISPEHRKQAISEGRFPPPNMFAVSISNIPESVARRPSQQQGLSVYGFDRLDVLKALFAMGIVKPFLFAHSAPYSDDHVNRELIQPSIDPFLETVQLFESTYVPPPPRLAPALKQ